MKNAVLLKCRSFRYNESEKEILKDFEFKIKYGQITLLSGISGSGKSTLISLINGIIPRIISGIFEGEIFIDGQNTKTKSMSEISRKVGSVLQNAESQIINQTVEDEIAFACENFGFHPSLIDKRIQNSCSMMKINREWKTRTLSGGQKQRVVSASTLAMDTDILMFDEPLANLDGEGCVIFLELLKKLADSGKAVLIIEHRLDLVLPYADTVWSLKNGCIEKVESKIKFLKSQSDIIKDKKENHVAYSENALELSGIKKKFDKREILCGIDLKIKKGERILLAGENGCGKSTLMNIIGRLLKSDEGTITTFLDDECGKRAGKKWFKKCGIVFQNPNYQLFMSSVRDEILFNAENPDYALCLADWFELIPLLDRHPHSLSEGQKRRLTVCSILAQKPKLLLLDEPTVGQDYHTLNRMIEIINHIHKEQQNTIITITHDIRCKKALCDREVKIKDGIIIS